MSSPSPLVIPIPIPPTIVSLTAPLVLGEIFTAYLFGVLSVQVYLYFLTFPKDSIYIKTLVYTVFALEFASGLMDLLDLYHWFAAGFGSMLSLNDIHLSAFDGPMLGSFVAAAVQMFYCYRIYVINKKAWFISVIVGLFSLAQASGGIYGAVLAERARVFSKSTHEALIGAYIVYVGAAAADVLIAVTMITLLIISRQRTGPHQNSRSAIGKIINLIVETNLASASVAVLIVILLVAIPGTNYFTCPSLILGRIYSNSLLLILNNRNYLRTGRETEFSGAVKLGSMTTGISSYTHHGTNPNPTVRIGVDSVTEGSFNDVKRAEGFSRV